MNRSSSKKVGKSIIIFLKANFIFGFVTSKYLRTHLLTTKQTSDSDSPPQITPQSILFPSSSTFTFSSKRTMLLIPVGFPPSSTFSPLSSFSFLLLLLHLFHFYSGALPPSLSLFFLQQRAKRVAALPLRGAQRNICYFSLSSCVLFQSRS
jgi:hypothetical protein